SFRWLWCARSWSTPWLWCKEWWLVNGASESKASNMRGIACASDGVCMQRHYALAVATHIFGGGPARNCGEDTTLPTTGLVHARFWFGINCSLSVIPSEVIWY